MSETQTLSGEELASLVNRVFRVRESDRALGMLLDLPDSATPDNPNWRARRAMAAGWAEALAGQKARTDLEVHVILYRNVRAANADLPPKAWLHAGGALPASADELDEGKARRFEELLGAHSILMAPTEFSATAPLKLCARRLGFRAATMAGFSEEMIPALRLDYVAINQRVGMLKGLLDRARRAEIEFVVDGSQRRSLVLDLRHRTAHASGGLIHDPGASNLPSGEAYVVPYEGEKPGDPTQSAGELPVQLGADLVTYRIVGNRAVEVLGDDSEVARTEAKRLRDEPAYGNLAELGLGVLSEFGVAPCGELLLDEKLGLHIAFGRSDHFGGQVGAHDFSRPEAVVHLDRVYLPSLQPRVRVPSVDLVLDGGERLALMRDGRYQV